MASENEPVTFLFMLIGNVKLPEYKNDTDLRENLSKLQKEIEEDVAKTYKLTVKIVGMIKNAEPNRNRSEFDVVIPGAAIVKLQCQADQIDAFKKTQTWKLKDNFSLQKIENTIDQLTTMNIPLEVLDNIPGVDDYLKDIMFFLCLQSRLDGGNYVIAGNWINVAIARNVIIGLSDSYASSVTICCENAIVDGYDCVYKFFQDPYFGKKIGGRPFSVKSEYDIAVFCYMLSQLPHTMESMYSFGIGMQWELDFTTNRIKIRYLHQKEEKLFKHFNSLRDQFQQLSSKFQSVNLPHFLPQNYKEFLMDVVKSKFKPEITVKLRGIRHVYMLVMKQETKKVNEFIDMYVTLNHPDSKKIWQNEPCLQSPEKTLTSYISTTPKRNSTLLHQTPNLVEPISPKTDEKTVIGYFHRDKETLNQFYQEKLSSMKGTASKYNGLFLMYGKNKNMIIVEGNSERDVTQFLDWLDMIYEDMFKTAVSKVEHVPVNHVAPITASSNINPSSSQKGSNNDANSVSNRLIGVFKHKCANTQIEVLKGDITKLRVDAIVNAANGRLKHGAGLARAIAFAAGEDLVRESDQTIASLGHNILPGDTCTTTGGNLQCRVVIHAVGPIYKDYQSLAECTEVLMRTFESCLNDAFGQQCSTVAIPAISSGIYGVPKETVAYAAAATITEYLEKNPECGITEIKMIDIDEEMLELFNREFKKFVNKKRLISVK